MGYLSDNIPPGQNFAFCQDLYLFRIILQPGFLSNIEITSIVKDEIPDVEEWQFSGRRRCPVLPARGKERAIRRVINPSTWAQNSRRMRPFTEEVHLAFHTTNQRAQVAARFDQERISYRLENAPS
jgi:hypothetical protein